MLTSLLLNRIGTKPTSLMVLPYFTPSGTPYFDIDCKGAILGLRLTTKREEVLRALLEGVAYEMRLNLDILERADIHIDELVATGGGSKSAAWMQLKADLLNKPIYIHGVSEAGCMGAAMLACSAHSGRRLIDIARQWAQITGAVEPNAENAQIYNEHFETYLKLYPAIRTLV